MPVYQYTWENDNLLGIRYRNKLVCNEGFRFVINIHRRSDYIIEFVTPEISPNKSENLTWLIAPVHNIGYVAKSEWKTTYMASQTRSYCLWSHFLFFICSLSVFHTNFAPFIVCQRCKPCEFLGFVWTDCWGNKSNYVITSPANWWRVISWWSAFLKRKRRLGCKSPSYPWVQCRLTH